ncbi:hypothetical protein P9869_31515 [Streptomyces ossamyceticus]|nr:hypothetical protein [Streptomyces ossamyceticus]
MIKEFELPEMFRRYRIVFRKGSGAGSSPVPARVHVGFRHASDRLPARFWVGFRVSFWRLIDFPWPYAFLAGNRRAAGKGSMGVM